MDLHAPDPVGKAAHDAALLALDLDRRLLVASSPMAQRNVRAAALSQLFEQWPKLCRAMATLEAEAPTTAATGQQADATMRDWIEHRVQP